MPDETSPQLLELDGLSVTVDEVRHEPNAVTPSDRPHCFVYVITIQNQSDVTVTIKGRKWVVRNAHGEINVMEGDGVVGKTPRLEPGEHFTYDSYHLIDTRRATAHGSYFGVDERGRRVMTRIPSFTMDVPAANV
jgi:ApaG protein